MIHIAHPFFSNLIHKYNGNMLLAITHHYLNTTYVYNLSGYTLNGKFVNYLFYEAYREHPIISCFKNSFYYKSELFTY